MRVFKEPLNCFKLWTSHCTCVYYHDWHRTKRPRPAVEGNILPAVSDVVSSTTVVEKANVNTSLYTSPRNTLTSSTGVVASNENPARSTPPPSTQQSQPSVMTSDLSFDEEAKLVYGVVLSLRNMIKKLSGRSVWAPLRQTVVLKSIVIPIEMSLLQVIGRLRTNYISMKQFQATNSSSWRTPKLILCGPSYSRYTQVLSWSTLCAIPCLKWIQKNMVSTTNTSVLVLIGLCVASLYLCNTASPGHNLLQ